MNTRIGTMMRHRMRAPQCFAWSCYTYRFDLNYHTNESGKLTTDILISPNFSQRSSIVYNPTRAVTKRPTILTLPSSVRVVQDTVGRNSPGNTSDRNTCEGEPYPPVHGERPAGYIQRQKANPTSSALTGIDDYGIL